MIYILTGLLVIALGLFALTILVQARQLDRMLDLVGQQNREAQDERRELINRAQFPDRMPAKSTGASTVHSNLSVESRQALAQVGKIAPQRMSDGD